MKKLNPGALVISTLRDKLAKVPLPDAVINSNSSSNPPKANLFVENEQFRTLFDLSPDVIVQTNPDGIIRMINASCLDFFGYSPEEMVGQSILDFYVDDSARGKKLELMVKSGYVRNFRVKMKAKNGEIKIASLNSRYSYDQLGNVIGIDTLIRDETEKIKAKEEAAISKDFYETILNALTADLAVFDMENRYQFLNTHSVKDAELRKWMIGKTDFDYCKHKGQDDSIAKARVKNLDLVKASDQTIEWVEQLTNKNGDKNYVLRILKHFCDGHGKEFIVGSGINVTQLKNAEERALKREKQLNEAQQLAKIGSYEWNPKTGDVTCSNEIFNILETENPGHPLTIEDFIGYIHPTDAQKVSKLKEQFEELDASATLELKIITATAKEKYIASRHSVLRNDDGAIQMVGGTIQDITEQKEFEKRLFHAVIESEENERNRIAGELHDGVCQDLTVAKLTIELVDAMVPDEDKSLKEMIERCRKIILQSLNMTRKVSHQLMPKEFFNRHFCDITTEMINQLNKVDSIKYELAITGSRREISPFVTINLYRIIQEFIRNSQKHSDTEKVTIDIHFSQEKLSLFLRDFGQGFDLKSKDEKGIGLLNIGKRIDGIGGSFQYKTKPGKGVELKIAFPLGE